MKQRGKLKSMVYLFKKKYMPSIKGGVEMRCLIRKFCSIEIGTKYETQFTGSFLLRFVPTCIMKYKKLQQYQVLHILLL